MAHALVFGASGITGWGVVNALLSDYPSADAFERVTALTNRPLSVEDSQWPASKKLSAISGLDLLSGDQASLDESMRQRVPNIESVTHLYFFAYLFNPDPEKEIQINVDLLRKAVTAVDNLSTNLSVVVIPTGVKVEFLASCDGITANRTFYIDLRSPSYRQIPVRRQATPERDSTGYS